MVLSLGQSYDSPPEMHWQGQKLACEQSALSRRRMRDIQKDADGSLPPLEAPVRLSPQSLQKLCGEKNMLEGPLNNSTGAHA